MGSNGNGLDTYSHLGDEMKNFFQKKSYMPKWNFVVHFFAHHGKQKSKHIFGHHVVSVQIPQYKMKSQTTMYGPVPKSFPLLDHESPFNIQITFEEDRYGTIINFINELQKSVITESGLHWHPVASKYLDIVIELHNYENEFICQWRAPESYFLNAQEVDLSYTTNDSMRFNITFGVDIIEYSYNKALQKQKNDIHIPSDSE